jgi:hypothetical protein
MAHLIASMDVVVTGARLAQDFVVVVLQRVTTTEMDRWSVAER